MTETVSIETLSADPANVRRHPQRNLDSIKSSLRRFGQQKPIVVDRNNVVRAGNGTLEAARAIGWSEIEIRRTELTGSEATAFSIADNRSSELSGWDEIELARSLSALQIEGIDLNAIGFGNADLSELVDAIAKDDAKPEPLDELREDPIFPSTNVWGIPELRDDLLSELIPSAVWGKKSFPHDQTVLLIYGHDKIPAAAKGHVLGFFTDDYRFERMWNEAPKQIESMRRFGWGAVIGPDFSVWSDDPLAVQLWNLYRSRWCARYWQEAGVKVIPNLNWAGPASLEWAFAGIPKSPPVVACQCRTVRKPIERLRFIEGVEAGLRAVEPGTLVIYGGDLHREWIEPKLEASCDIVWLTSRAAVRRKEFKEQNHELVQT